MIVYTLIFVTLIAFFFDRMVARWHPDSLWSWRSAFVSTLISVVLGLVVGLKLFEFSQKTATVNDRARYVRLIGYELASLKDLLSDTGGSHVTINGKPYPMLLTHLEPVVIEDAARSGLFREAETENLLSLARIIRVLNMECQVAVNIVVSAPSNDSSFLARVQMTSNNLEKTRTAALAKVEDIQEELQTDGRQKSHVGALDVLR